MISLRPYQEKIVADVRAAYKGGARAPLLVSPTGSGKTVIFSYITESMYRARRPVMILVHRAELLEQVSQTLKEFGVPHGIVDPLHRPSPHEIVQCVSVWSLIRRSHYPAAHLVIVDEAHHCVPTTTWGRVVSHYAQSKLLGVTATPIRLSGEGLGDVFDTLVVGPNYPSLLACGALAPLVVYAPSCINTEGVHTRAGDFVNKELAALIDRPTITGDAVQSYKKFGDGKSAVVFCCSVEHAHHVAGEFAANGVAALPIDGSLAPEIRRGMVQDFTLGRIRVLTSCDLISEGFDVPRIEIGISLRPTQSEGLWLQQVGRILRPFPGKERAILLDHAGNSVRHGLPTEVREWSLSGGTTRTSSQEPRARICPFCFAASPATNTACVECSRVFPKREVDREPIERAGELAEVDEAAIKRARTTLQFQAKSLEELRALGKALKYKPGWAEHVYKARMAKQGRREAE